MSGWCLVRHVVNVCGFKLLAVKMVKFERKDMHRDVTEGNLSRKVQIKLYRFTYVWHFR